MNVLQDVLRLNDASGYYASMRNLLTSSAVFSLLSFSSWATSYHDNVGVLQYVNPKIGTYGVTPNGNGGMIPSVSPPFGMTRWTPQTR
jgi:putative alpha-1,2-mannosidase